MMEYKIGEIFCDRVHVVCVQDNDLIAEINGINYSAELSNQTIIQRPAGFVQENYLVDYFKSMLPHTKIHYEQDSFYILFITDNNKFYLENTIAQSQRTAIIKTNTRTGKKLNFIFLTRSK